LLLYRSRRFSDIGSENRKSLRFEKPLLSAGGISCHSMKAVVANNRPSEVRYPHATAVAEGAIVTPARPIMAPIMAPEPTAARDRAIDPRFGSRLWIAPYRCLRPPASTGGVAPSTSFA
jgi:hypothetical protein